MVQTAARALGRALMVLGALHVLIVFTPILRWWTQMLTGPWEDAVGEVMILLGGDSVEGDFLGRTSYWRAVSAAHAWKQGGFRRVFVSGGGINENVPVARRIKDYLVFSGVPESAVETEEQSTSTRENALFCAARLGREPGRKVLLTSEFHVFRARRAFERAGLPVVARPVPDAGKQWNRFAERWCVFLELATETAKIGYYAARGWL